MPAPTRFFPASARPWAATIWPTTPGSGRSGASQGIEELEAAVSAWSTAHTVAEISDALTAAGVPFGPVAEIPEVMASPQIKAREMLVAIEHDRLGPLVLPGIPVKLSVTPGSVRKAPPVVGEDNDRVYRDLLGLSAARVAELRAEGAI